MSIRITKQLNGIFDLHRTNYEEARCIRSVEVREAKYCQPTYFMGIFELTTRSSIHVQGTVLSCLFVLAMTR